MRYAHYSYQSFITMHATILFLAVVLACFLLVLPSQAATAADASDTKSPVEQAGEQVSSLLPKEKKLRSSHSFDHEQYPGKEEEQQSDPAPPKNRGNISKIRQHYYHDRTGVRARLGKYRHHMQQGGGRHRLHGEQNGTGHE